MFTKLKEMSKSVLGSLLVVAVAVIAFIGVKELKVYWFQSTSEQKAKERVTEKVDQEIRSAQSRASAEKSATEVLVEQSRKNIANTLSSASTQKQKLVAASDIFFGAYFLNTRARAEYCATLGVPISTFVNTYKQLHQQLFVSAEAIQIVDFHEHGRKYDIEKFYQLLAPAAKKFVIQDMKDSASSLGMSEKDLCHEFNNNAVSWVKMMDIRTRAPEVSRLLLQKVSVY